jgi:hypothetical protein
VEQGKPDTNAESSGGVPVTVCPQDDYGRKPARRAGMPGCNETLQVARPVMTGFVNSKLRNEYTATITSQRLLRNDHGGKGAS